MRSFSPWSAQRGPAVLSLSVLANSATPPPRRSPFEILVRHLLARFFQNEAMVTDEDSKRAVQLCYLVALPGLLIALYLFPSYHAYPIRRTFWPQVSDHYFYVTYSFVVMGMVTIYQWDLLFPDLLDIFVLSILPMRNRRLFLARISAIAIFLGLVLAGANSLGGVFLPAVADLPHRSRHCFAHFSAIFASGVFASALFLALQGVLLNLFSARFLNRILPFIQAGSIILLLTMLFLFPLISAALPYLLNVDIGFVRWFPPFWFLGIYERILGGSTALPFFHRLAVSGCWATGIALVFVFGTYPLAYKRKVRQLIEGPSNATTRKTASLSTGNVLHSSLLHLPSRRATFHFVQQSLLRTRRHRVVLAMHGGVGIALAVADLIMLRLGHHHIRIAWSANGIRSAIPVIAFWTAAGMRNAVITPLNRAGSWVFRIISGRPTWQHLNGAMLLVAAWSIGLSLSAVFLLRAVAPESLRNPLSLSGQAVAAIGCGLLLTDLLFLKVLVFPFTALRRTSITDLPLAFFRYFVLFPTMVFAVVDSEIWVEASLRHILTSVVLIMLAHAGLRYLYYLRVQEMRMGSDFGDSDDIFQSLGLAE